MEDQLMNNLPTINDSIRYHHKLWENHHRPRYIRGTLTTWLRPDLAKTSQTRPTVMTDLERSSNHGVIYRRANDSTPMHMDQSGAKQWNVYPSTQWLYARQNNSWCVYITVLTRLRISAMNSICESNKIPSGDVSLIDINEDKGTMVRP